MVKQQDSPKKKGTEGDYAWAVQQWQKVVTKWQSLPKVFRYFITALLVMVVILLIIPKNDTYSAENPIGIEAISQSVKGYSDYSAEPIKNGSITALAADGSITDEVPLTDVGTTKSEVALPTLAQQEAEYEAFFASLNESRKINGMQTSVPTITEETSSPSSTPPEVSSVETSSAEVSSAEVSSTAVSEPAVSSSIISEEQTTVETEEAVTYTIQAGDNLYRIGINNGLTLEEIMALNGMSVPEVTPGQVIRVR